MPAFTTWTTMQPPRTVRKYSHDEENSRNRFARRSNHWYTQCCRQRHHQYRRQWWWPNPITRRRRRHVTPATLETRSSQPHATGRPYYLVRRSGAVFLWGASEVLDISQQSAEPAQAAARAPTRRPATPAFGNLCIFCIGDEDSSYRAAEYFADDMPIRL